MLIQMLSVWSFSVLTFLQPSLPPFFNFSGVYSTTDYITFYQHIAVVPKFGWNTSNAGTGTIICPYHGSRGKQITS